MIFSPIRFPANVGISVFFMVLQNSIVCMYHIFFISLCFDGYAGWFHVLAKVNGAALDMDVQIAPWQSPLVMYPRGV